MKKVNDCIRNRVLLIVDYVLRNRCTVREAAPIFGVSKSTVHSDITKRAKEFVSDETYKEILELMRYNRTRNNKR